MTAENMQAVKKKSIVVPQEVLFQEVSFHPIEASFTVDVLENGFVQSQFQTGLVKHFPLIRVPRNQSVDFHRFTLTNPMAACLGLTGSRQEKGK